jgi:CheY-like chemotaxis protein
MTCRDDAIEFASEPNADTSSGAPAWKILIADDDKAVHSVVRLALANLTVARRPMQFRDAYHGEEVCRVLSGDADIALILMDLAMEGPRSGLEAARVIREAMGNRRVRIVLCTGEIEPELRAGTMAQLDLNDCWQKTELTAHNLAAIVQAALRTYGARPESNRSACRYVTGTFQHVPLSVH